MLVGKGACHLGDAGILVATGDEWACKAVFITVGLYSEALDGCATLWVCTARLWTAAARAAKYAVAE